MSAGVSHFCPYCIRKVYRDTFNFTFTYIRVLQALLIEIRKSTSQGPINCADKYGAHIT